MGFLSVLYIVMSVLMLLVVPLVVRRHYHENRMLAIVLGIGLPIVIVGFLISGLRKAKVYQREATAAVQSTTFLKYYHSCQNPPRPRLCELAGVLGPGGASALANVNLRKEPTSRSRLLATIPKEAILHVVQSPLRSSYNMFEERNGWFRVNYRGTQGWVAGDLIRPITPVEQTTQIAGTWRRFWTLTFPEPTFAGKLLWFLVGLVLDASLMPAFPERVNVLRGTALSAFFIIKGLIRGDFVWTEFYFVFFLVGAWSFLLDAIVAGSLVRFRSR